MAANNGTAIQQHEPTPDPDRERLDLVKRNYGKDADDNEFALFLDVADKLGLDPRAKQIYLISRYSGAERRKVATIQIGIDGLRLMAERSGQYAGSDAPLWCGPDGLWSEIWFGDTPPIAAKVTVWRKGSERPVVGVAMFKNFRESSPLWSKMPEHMLAIAAERQALRKAFPADIAAWESSVREATIAIEDTTDDAPTARPEPPKQLPAPQPEAPPPAAQAMHVVVEAPDGAEASRAPESAPGGGTTQEKPEITGFYELCAAQLQLDRAGVKHLLGVTVADDTAAITAALDARELSHSRKGLAALAGIAATLVQARDAEPVPDDDPMIEPAESYAL